MARKRKGLPIHGVILLDKPQGISSNHLLQRVKRLFQAQKAGHTGALDPLATGMLPICLGEATKFSQYLLDSDKCYRVKAQLGIRTDTSDADGNAIQTRPVTCSELDILTALEHFRGDVMQTPTMFSALKHQGRPLYEYARQGITIKREPRPITIYKNQFCGLEKNQLELEIHCSKGTYIRTIVDDLGELLGCGAHVIELRRLQVSTYPINKMVTLETLEAIHEDHNALLSHLMPMDSPVQEYPKLQLTKAQTDDILFGRTLNVDTPFLSKEELVRIYYQNSFIGVGNLTQHQLSPKRLISSEFIHFDD